MAGCYHLNSKFISKSSSLARDVILQLLKKLKLYRKLGLDTVFKATISFRTKIYLWSLVDYQHLQKYFYNWNITLNYYFICKINIRGNFLYLEMPLVALNTHILTPLFHPLSKTVNNSKGFVSVVLMIMSFQSFEVFYSSKINFFLFASLW